MSETLSNEELALAFLQWLLTPEGDTAQVDAQRRADDTRSLLAKGNNISWEKVHEPFTI